jgi:hypothetical protein
MMQSFLAQYQTALILGAIGGGLPDILRLIEGRHGQLPTYLGSWYFWVSLFLLVILGAAVAVALPGAENDWIRPLAVGYAGPSVISKVLSDASTMTRSVTRPSLRSWWAV